MVNKISGPIGPPETAAVESAAAAGAEQLAAVDSPSRAAEAAATDAVTRIAEEVAQGRISREEAVQRIIGEALVATDPTLQSLVRGLGSARSREGA